jgi:hypothetical protein
MRAHAPSATHLPSPVHENAQALNSSAARGRAWTRATDNLQTKMNEALSRAHTYTLADDSDLVDEGVAADFAARILLYESIADGQRLNKEAFEAAWTEARRTTGRTVTRVSSTTNPGCDIEEGTEAKRPFSCKTESGERIKADTVVISKLMSCKDISNFHTKRDVALKLRDIKEQLDRSGRLLDLRVFDSKAESGQSIRTYQLVEIPQTLFEGIDTMSDNRLADCQWVIKRNGQRSKSISVPLHGGRTKAGELFFDSSVLKVSLRVPTRACRVHCSWTFPQ